MDTKTLQRFKLLSDEGTVEAVFSTLNVRDADGDITLPGAFQEGQEVRISGWNHSSWDAALPVGKGRIELRGDAAVLVGQFFTDTTAGRDTFQTVKQLGDLGRWSYGYDVLDAERGVHDGEPVRFLKGLHVHEVAPVLVPAGVGTRTLAVKNDTPFSEQADRVLGDVKALLERARAFGSQSTDEDRKAGRVLSAANRDRLSTLHAALREADVTLDELLTATDPDAEKQRHDDVMRAVLLAEIARSHLTPFGGADASTTGAPRST